MIQKRYPEALQNLLKVKNGSEYPDKVNRVELLGQIGKIYFDKLDGINAYINYKELETCTDQHADMFFALGTINLLHQRYSSSINYFQKLLEIKSNHAQAAFYLGIGHMASQNYAEAKSMWSVIQIWYCYPCIAFVCGFESQ